MAEHAARFEAALVRANEAVARVPPRTAVPLAQDEPRPSPSADQVNEFEHTLRDLGSIFGELRDGRVDAFVEADELRRRVAGLKDRWLATADHAPPPANVADRSAKDWNFGPP